MNNTKIFSVSQLNGYVKDLFDEDVLLEDISVCGEISNYKKHSSGHMYFTLKDSSAAINAAMFKWMGQYLRFIPSNGMRVVAKGKVTLYEPTGQYQLVIQSMQLDGEGALYAQYEKLKARLEAEGLFAPERKRALPEFPERIGVITSKTGAAVKDIFSVLGRRWPFAEIIFAPAIVQGVEAPISLINALNKLNTSANCDVIIIGRGGGSIEDLWAFNDEAVVRTVAASKTVIVSAVGHETDFTLCDFAADLRAPTPSAAAELVAPDSFELQIRIEQLRSAIDAAQKQKLNELSYKLNFITARPCFASPLYFLDIKAQRADNAEQKLHEAMAGGLLNAENKLALAAKRLSVLDPMAVLARGYCSVYKADALVTSAASLTKGDKIKLQFAESQATCTVD